jgi:DNA-directed RNA polymerase specialized sigma24 family protein
MGRDEDVFVTESTTADLEHSLQRYGDDLYRLALLLAPTTTDAADALLAAARRLGAAGPALDERALLAALSKALPPERRAWRWRRLPAWTNPPPQRAADARLLAAIARLPRQQRLALGLTLLRGREPAEAAALLDGDETTLRERVRDALLALAPVAGGRPVDAGQPTIDLRGTEAPDACRPTRAALALGDPALHANPAVRGHLALCPDCRAAEQAWSHLTRTVEDVLRGALREARLPDELAEQLRAAATAQPAAGWRASRGLRIALVALPVLALIAFLIAPRGGHNAAQSGALGPLPPPPDPRALVQRANEYLYAPPPGSGVWHARYAIQWVFASGTYALLAADQWIEPASGRHRLQLVHYDGGGPYEFELGDGVRTAWYAVSDSYAPSLYPLSVGLPAPRVHLDAMPEQQQQMLSARLQAGAWGLPAAYLRQAQTAELHTWGRQRSPDGAVVSLISFSGISPLGPPPDAPNLSIGQITILLALDEASGRLREVRELVGPLGGEQATRTTWRVESEEWLSDPDAIAGAFDQRRAWNGVGAFTDRGPLADPALPLAQTNKVVSLALAIQRPWTGVWMPARPPPGATTAVLLNQSNTPVNNNSFPDNERLTFTYLGTGRRLEFDTREPQTTPPLVGGEVLALGDQQLIMLPGFGQSYRAKLTHSGPFGGPALATWVIAFGYTRAELLDVLRSFGPPTLESYRAQARLFIDPQSHDATFDALLAVLDPPLGDGAVRHTVEHIFARQNSVPDPQTDPYHVPRYEGIPERTVRESWVRGTAISGTLETAISASDTTGALYGRMYISPGRSWAYMAPTSQLVQFATETFFELDVWSDRWQPVILNMLACGPAELLANADGTRTVFLTDTSWQTDSCQHPIYPSLFRTQTTGEALGDSDRAPYLSDISDPAVTTWVDLDARGRLLRVEVRAGAARDGALLESWELAQDELLAADRVPAAAFDPTPPEAFLRWQNLDTTISQPPLQDTVTLTEALAMARSPLFGLPGGDGVTTLTDTAALSATLVAIEASTPPAEGAPGSAIGDEAPFLSALRYGYALRLTYNFPEAPLLYIYEGPAKELGSYLRATAHWRSSTPVTLGVGARKISGWQVTTAPNDTWTLFEIDGTLIAVWYPAERAAAVIAALRPIARP